LVARHHRLVRAQLARSRGGEIDTGLGYWRRASEVDGFRRSLARV
jgi:hypothetical protein